MDRSFTDRAVGAGTSVGLHAAIALLALWPIRHVVREIQVPERPGPEIFFLDALPPEAPAAAGLNAADPSAPLWTPKPGTAPSVGAGGMRFDIDKVMSRATLLFPFLTPGISLDRFGLSPADIDEKRLRMPPQFTRQMEPPAKRATPPLQLGSAGVQALVDRSWSRRSRWKPFEPLAGLTEGYHPDTGQLPAILRGFTEQNSLQPYVDPGIRDPRMWTELQIAADHVDFIAFISKFAAGHPSTRSTTELLFLLDRLVQANRDALVTLLDTDPWTDLEWTRHSNLDAVTFIVELQRHYNSVLVRKKLLGRESLGMYYDDIRIEILKGILRTTPDGYRASDASYLMGSVYWRQGRRMDALRVWRDVHASPDNEYTVRNADIEAAMKTLVERPAAFNREIERILAADSGGWLSDSIDRLKRFGLKMDQYEAATIPAEEPIMKIRWTLVLGLAFVAVSATRAAAPVTYGKGVTLNTATPLATLLKNPATLEGKTVRVEGVVTAVCQAMGCWMALGAKDAAGEPTVMVKVDDGVIVFPVSAKGKKAAAQGVVQRVKADDHEANEAAREKAHATSGAPASGGHDAHGAQSAHGAPGAHDAHGAHAAHGAPAAPGAKTAAPDTWQLKATGAIVY